MHIYNHLIVSFKTAAKQFLGYTIKLNHIFKKTANTIALNILLKPVASFIPALVSKARWSNTSTSSIK